MSREDVVLFRMLGYGIVGSVLLMGVCFLVAKTSACVPGDQAMYLSSMHLGGCANGEKTSR